MTYAESGYKRDFVNKQIDPKELEDMTVQHRFADKWSLMDPGADVRVIRSIEEALNFARAKAEQLDVGAGTVHAYVTGSLHLVGGALGLLEKADAL